MRNMNDILRQAQVMQSKLSKLQQEMAERSYEAPAAAAWSRPKFPASRSCVS